MTIEKGDIGRGHQNVQETTGIQGGTVIVRKREVNLNIGALHAGMTVDQAGTLIEIPARGRYFN